MDSARRGIVAMIAAYAVALQALLSGWLPAAPAVLANDNPFAVICSHDAAGGTGQPASHDLPCAAICAALGHAVAGPLPLAVSVAMGSARVLSAVAPDIERTAPHRSARNPQIPRGPPLA
jgi:hypothetical protein